MRLTLGQLKRLILREVGANGGFPGEPYGRNVNSPDINTREQIGSLAGEPEDVVDDPDKMPEHLRDVTVSPEDCFGPVPPNAEEPYVGQDPFTRDISPLPTGGIKRGPGSG